MTSEDEEEIRREIARITSIDAMGPLSTHGYMLILAMRALDAANKRNESLMEVAVRAYTYFRASTTGGDTYYTQLYLRQAVDKIKHLL